MNIKKFTLSDFQSNCYVIGCENTKEAVIVDPGECTEEIINAIEEENYVLKNIIFTHGHGDHIAGAKELKDKFGADILAHEAEVAMIKDPKINMSSMMSCDNVSLDVDRPLKDGDSIDFGDKKIEVIHTPGHSKGGICLKINEHLFTGDTLFPRSIGRTDFVGGDYDEIISSIKGKLMTLSGKTKVHPGHGNVSSIGKEKLMNPFVK